MRHRPARQRYGYHKTLTKARRRNRWLLAIGMLLLAVGANRCASALRQPTLPTGPGV
jgi:hypothetical protein